MKRVSSSRINTGCSYCHCCHHVSPRRKALPRPRLQASRKKASLKNSSTELARDSDTNQSGPQEPWSPASSFLQGVLFLPGRRSPGPCPVLRLCH